MAQELQTQKQPILSLPDLLREILARTEGNPIKIKDLYAYLHGRGLALTLIIFSLPFCFPIQIPGLSTFFGLAICVIGFKYAFSKKLWMPRWLQEKEIPHPILVKIINQAIWVSDKLKKYLYPRYPNLVDSKISHVVHGITIAILGFLLALPLPIPLTNMLAAISLVVMGLGLLEEDGAAIIVAYLLFIVCICYYAAIIWVGVQGAAQVINH